MKTIIALSFLALSFMGLTAHTESYIGKEPPPDSILAQYIPSSDSGTKDIVGLYKEGENSYKVFYYKRKENIDFKTIIHLETNKWLVNQGMSWEEIMVP